MGLGQTQRSAEVVWSAQGVWTSQVGEVEPVDAGCGAGVCVCCSAEVGA